MNPKRKQRLITVGFAVFGISVAVGLAAYALRANIDLFFNPSQIATGDAPVEQRIRIGGMVVENSVRRDPESLKVQFTLTDYKNTVHVSYTGILPDLFREGQGVVTSGQLDRAGIFVASEVLAKHDEKYMPPTVQRALDSASASQ